MAEQCCPTPTQAFPTVMNLEIAAEDVGNFDKINAMISEKAADADMTGRLSGWPVPITIFLPEFAVEVAKDLIDSGKTPEEALSSEYLIALAQDKFGVGVEMNPMKPEMDNYYLTIMDSIFY